MLYRRKVFFSFFILLFLFMQVYVRGSVAGKCGETPLTFPGLITMSLAALLLNFFSQSHHDPATMADFNCG